MSACASSDDDTAASVAVPSSALAAPGPNIAAPANDAHPAPLTAIAYPARWDTATEAPATVSEPVPETRPDIVVVDEIALGGTLTFPGDLLFEKDSDVLSEWAGELLTDFADAVNQQLADTQELEVHGWVDTLGEPAYNADLAQRRADAVTSRLLRRAPLLSGRIEAIGHGETDLLDRSCLGDCPTNRAVTVVVGAP